MVKDERKGDQLLVQDIYKGEFSQRRRGKGLEIRSGKSEELIRKIFLKD